MPARARQCGIEVGGVTVRVRGFGELEAVVMDRIWNRDGTTTVREIFDGLAAEREIAYTTVMSTMDNLHTKGWLARERDGVCVMRCSGWPDAPDASEHCSVGDLACG
jgi:hypothetical protein